MAGGSQGCGEESGRRVGQIAQREARRETEPVTRAKSAPAVDPGWLLPHGNVNPRSRDHQILCSLENLTHWIFTNPQF